MAINSKYDKGLKLVLKYIVKVFPEVKRQLNNFTQISGRAHDSQLSRQAYASIESKSFHCQGGSVYALYPNVSFDPAVRFIVSLQTISDYLDNLCDRTEVKDGTAFYQLHTSMLDAVTPSDTVSDYYMYYPYKSDNGYLLYLVRECKSTIRDLPSYGKVLPFIERYVKLYSELQTYKHLDNKIREERMKKWAGEHINNFSEISIWEFSAASGSTLGIFAMYSAACDPSLSDEEVQLIDRVYFPWICGLHILLDYYIDYLEDMETDDLNFTYYYENMTVCKERIIYFVEKSLKMCSDLRYPLFHSTVVKGLLAMYLSDQKALQDYNRQTTCNILKRGGKDTGTYYRLCRILRSSGIL